jgi:hypothetical protein
MLRKRNYFIYNTAIFQILLLILSSFAIAFIFSESFGGRVDAMTDDLLTTAVVTTNPSQPPTASNPPPITLNPSSGVSGYRLFTPGSTYANLPSIEGMPAGTYQWVGPQNPNVVGGNQIWRAADGVQYVRPNIDPSQLSVVQVNPAQQAAWGKTIVWNGQQVSATQAMANPSAYPGMVDSAGKLTPAAQQAFQQAGVTNPTVSNGQVVIGNTPNGPPAPQAGIMESIFGGQAFGIQSTGAIWTGALVSGLVWGAIVGGAAYFLAGMFGLNDKQAASIGLGLGAGTFVGSSLYLIGQNSATAAAAGVQGVTAPTGAWAWATSGFGALVIGAGVATAIILLTYKKEKKELVRFQCLPWEAPTGGSRCDECNNDPLMPCSEYRCKSLGQACEIVNPGTTEEKCVWVSKGDTSAPHIIPLDDALSPDGLRYYPDATISPPNRGFLIKDTSGNDECLPAFSNLEFGVETDEPAQCRIDYEAKNKYSEMQFLLGESNLFLEEHVQRLKVPNTNEEGDVVPEIGVDGTFTLWVRCIDANGNGEDSAAVAFSFCVDEGPDTTQPTIEGSSIETGRPVQFGVDSVPIEVYINEPSECKWSRIDKAYSDMENTMECGTESYQINADLNYVCSSQLTGIVNREDNWFYFRCKDMAGNVMVTSYPLLLRGTEQLVITKVGPKGEFVGSTSVMPVSLEVETAHGADNGNATCSFSNTETGRFVVMDNTGNGYLHNQSLDLAGGLSF